MAKAGIDTDGEGAGDYREEEEGVVPELPFSGKKWLPPIMPNEDVSVFECSHVE